MGNKPQLRWNLIGAAMILIPTITIVLVEILGGLIHREPVWWLVGVPFSIAMAMAVMALPLIRRRVEKARDKDPQASM